MFVTVPKISVRRESFSVSILSSFEKFFASEAYVTIFDFRSNFFCLTVPKKFVGEHFCAVFPELWVSKSLDKRGRESRFSVRIFLSHSAKKFRRGTFLCFTTFGYRKSL